MDEEESNFSKVMEILGTDGDDELPAEGLEQDNPQEVDEAGDPEGQTEEGEGKPKLVEGGEAEKPFEAPVGWRSDEKAIFESLDRNAQEAVLRIDQAQNAHFTQRSTELAHKIRATDDERQQYQSERARHQSELGRLSQMAAQLLPAKFQDIQNESDYLRLKATDPARASEFEAFKMTINMAQQQQDQIANVKAQEHLAREYQMLSDKYPEFRDGAKAQELLNGVRKAATDYYGFNPAEVQVIQDHRYVPIIQDAMAWRQHQANLKAAQTKKAAPVMNKVLNRASNSGGTVVADDNKRALLNRARQSGNDRDKADAVFRYLNS